MSGEAGVDRRQTPPELASHLAEQRAFLGASCSAFDSGTDAEAKRLAVACRVLVHDTQNSHGLLAQMGLSGSVQVPNSGTAFPPSRDVHPATGTVTLSVGVFLRLVSMSISAEGARFAARLDRVPGAPTCPLDEWWNTPVLRAAGAGSLEAPHEVTRRDVVLGLANMDGGAHVDPEPRFAWWLSTRSGTFGRLEQVVSPDGSTQTQWSVPMGASAMEAASHEGAIVTPVYATMRVVAEELQAALRLASYSAQ